MVAQRMSGADGDTGHGWWMFVLFAALMAGGAIGVFLIVTSL
jgi:hypothetical protein